MKPKEKLRLRRERRRRRIFIAGIAVLLSSVVLFVRHQAAISRIRSWERVETVRDTIDSFHFRTVQYRSDVWWLQTTPSADLAMHDELQARKERAAQIIRKGANISPETKRIASRFAEQFVSVFTPRGPRLVGLTDQKPVISASAINLCFLPKDAAVRERAFGPMWSSELQIVAVPALEYPEPVYAALLFHEFGHALRHNAHDGDRKPADDSDSYIQEEVEMHMLSEHVLDWYSGGAYRKLLADIVARTPRADHFDEALTALTHDDLVCVDHLFGCQSNDIPDTLLVSQTALDVSFKFCDDHGLGMRGKIAVYRWFEANIFAVPKGPPP